MSGQNLHFELPKALVLNANDRTHWAAKARVTKALRAMGAYAASQCESLDRAHLTVRIGWPDKRRRDAANLSPTLKALIDGAVDNGNGILPDDSDTYLTGPDLRPYVAGKTGIVVLDFEFRSITSGVETAKIASRNGNPAAAQTTTGSSHTDPEKAGSI